MPRDWKASIVQGKSYDVADEHGRLLYNQVQDRLQNMNGFQEALTGLTNLENRYGDGYTVYPRIGQGTFRVLVTEAYERRCAITGEKTLPVLDAAHIQPYSQEGPHRIQNGLLLRRDLHALFDRGYLTVNEDLRVEVSNRIKEDYGNGRAYYAMHGKELTICPNNGEDRPAKEYLRWHNNNVFLSS